MVLNNLRILIFLLISIDIWGITLYTYFKKKKKKKKKKKEKKEKNKYIKLLNN